MNTNFPENEMSYLRQNLPKVVEMTESMCIKEEHLDDQGPPREYAELIPVTSNEQEFRFLLFF